MVAVILLTLMYLAWQSGHDETARTQVEHWNPLSDEALNAELEAKYQIVDQLAAITPPPPSREVRNDTMEELRAANETAQNPQPSDESKKMLLRALR